MPVVEFLSVLTKPIVLMIRLFANMLAGHIVVLGFISIIFIFGTIAAVLGYGVSVVSLMFMVFLDLLEVLVALIQAYVFTLLSALYFGLATAEPEHHEAFQAVRAEQNRAQLERILQVTPELANWTTFIDGDRLKFNRMSQQDSVNLLMTALAQPPWTEYFELAAQKLQSANQQLSVSLRAVSNSKISVENLEANLAAAREDHREAQEEYQRQVDESARKIDELKNQIGADQAGSAFSRAGYGGHQEKAQTSGRPEGRPESSVGNRAPGSSGSTGPTG